MENLAPTSVGIFEEDLLWSQRLSKGAELAGFEPFIIREDQLPALPLDIALVNLSADHYDPVDLVKRLRLAGTKVVAHAGHKEKDLLELGKAAGVDRVATNGELAKNWSTILKEFSISGTTAKTT